MKRRIERTFMLMAALVMIVLYIQPVKAADSMNTGDSGAWEEVMEIVHHEEEGHYENQKTGEIEVIDKEAWDEYIEHWYYECTVCLYRSVDVVEINEHLAEHPTGEGYHYYDPVDGTEIYPSYREKSEYEIIHHDAETHMEDVYEDVWIVDREEYDETVPTGRFRYIVDGKPVINTALAIGGRIYPFGEDGIVRPDQWVVVSGKKYYTDNTGAAVTGWRMIHGRKYYFTDERYASYKEADRGKMMTGWALVGKRVYYFADSRYQEYIQSKEGIMLSGWKTVSGKRYYFIDSAYSEYMESKKGILLTGFRKIGGRTYYLTDSRAAGYKEWKRGILVTGLKKIGGKMYYFGKNGALCKNRRIRIGGRWYIADQNGVLR